MGKRFLTAQKNQQQTHLKFHQKGRCKKTEERTVDLAGTKIAEKITKAASKSTCADPIKLVHLKRQTNHYHTSNRNTRREIHTSY